MIFIFNILVFFISPASFAHSHTSDSDVPRMTPTRSYSMVVQRLNELHKSYPQNTELFKLGTSNDGVDIMGLKIGHGSVHNLVVATHHGNEYGSTAVAEGVAEALAANPIEGQSIYVIPVLNTGGYDRRSRRESVGPRSYDPNRDYPGPCGTQGPFILNSTRALAEFIALHPIVNVATLHTYASTVLYPWGISTTDVNTEYTSIFEDMGRAAAYMSGYKVGNSTLELYPADGTFEDYVFWNHGIWSLLFEMGVTHSPNPNQVADMVRTNVPGIRKMFEEAPIARAPHHSFTGKCDTFLRTLDLKNE